MTGWTLVRRGLRFYWRTHLGVVLGAAVASAVLVGALVVGDSVRHSLRLFALWRLGDVELALAPDRLFREQLAADLADAQATTTAPVLWLRGMAARGDGAARANHVQVLGVDRRFWAVGGADDALAALPEDGVALNQRLAAHLGVGEGDSVLLRVERPSALPRDAPLSTDADAATAFRPVVAAVVSDAGLGRFGLRAQQLPPFNAFVPLRMLQGTMELAGRANLLLVGGAARGLDAAEAGRLLRQRWQLADAGLELRELPERGVVELRTDRIFLDPPAAEAAVGAAPQAYGALTYFVNELRRGERSTPYSIVAAVGKGGPAPLVPPDMADDEIVLNQWLADDLAAKVDDTVALTYFVVGPMRELSERTSRFRVRAVVPITGAAADRDLMPDFPGVAGAANCRDWEPGIPIDLPKIRKKDEAYWEQYRGTPKAFVTLAAGQRMWGNRFGSLTAVRYPLDAGPKEKLAEAIRAGLAPASLGLFFRPVRAQALAAGTQALDFGQLFLGLSFFLIVAALLLTGLLFVLGVEQRGEEAGTLLALGYRPRHVRRLLLAEGGALAVVGGAVGTALGTGYTRLVLHGLTTVWGRAVAGTPVLRFHAEPSTLVVGALASVAAALAAMWLVLRRQARRPARELLAGADAAGQPGVATRSRVMRWIALAAVLAALAIVVWADASQDRRAAAAFFSGGALMLIGLMCASHDMLSMPIGARWLRLSLELLVVRNVRRRRGRSLAVVGLLACGTFLVVAVGANRRDTRAEARQRASGTGGFALLGESALPLFRDLNSQAGRDAYGLDPDTLEGVAVVSLRVREGDDASCLNLNRAQTPRLLGVRPPDLASRGAFAFARTLGPGADQSPWLLLDRDEGPDVVPCIGDEPTVVWGLDLKLGATLPYTDERGHRFRLRLVGILTGSVLQGSLLVSERRFEARFPSEAGYRAFLVDAPAERQGEVSAELSRALQDAGLELSPATARLAELGEVQNTYLSIFQALGGLGLLLGSVGLGVVVLRNVLERRGELALMRAVGFRRRALVWLLLYEHGVLVVWGLMCGTASALLAVVPAIQAPGASMPAVSLPLTIVAIAVSGLAWTWLAAAWALRSRLLPALRNE